VFGQLFLFFHFFDFFLNHFGRTVNQPSYREEWQAVFTAYITLLCKCHSRFSRFTYLLFSSLPSYQSCEIKLPPQAILGFKILGIFSVENKDRSGVMMYQSSDL
jgi:hypothetical protein